MAVAQLLERLEGDDKLVSVAVAVALLVQERHAVAPRLVDHGYGGRPLRELDEVHGVDGDATVVAAEAMKPMKATSDGVF